MRLRSSFLAPLLTLLLCSALMAEESPDSSDAPVTLAKVEGEAIHKNEVMTRAAQALKELRLEKLQVKAQQEEKRHQIIRQQLDQLISNRVLELEAKSRDLDSQRLIAQEIDDRVLEPSEETVAQIYTVNRNRLPGSEKQRRAKVRDYLKQQQRQKLFREFMESLKNKYKVQYFLQPHRFQVETEGRPSLGPEKAAVEIIEFSDFECSYCSKVAPTLKRLQDSYPEKVRLVYRHYPLRRIHANAQKAAEASLCANDQGKFWEMHDSLFGDQDGLSVQSLKAKAGELGLDLAGFEKCLDLGRHADEVEQDMLAGARAGVNGTPTIFINGRRLSGAVSYERIMGVVTEELNR